MSAHYNIPVFIPHYGCRHACIFCDQRAITGQEQPSDVSEAAVVVERYLGWIPDGARAEIAFFGGSFTGLAEDVMRGYLAMAQSYVRAGKVNGIRLSTRPDYISAAVCAVLAEYGVTAVELGVQSMSDDVLSVCARGHTAADTVRACDEVVAAGFELTGQMMLGLPQSSLADEIATAEFIAASGASGARIYPAIAFPNTRMFEMYREGSYTPLTLDEAVERCVAVKRIFTAAGVKLLRVGLCSTDMPQGGGYVGPYHPSFGELVKSAEYFAEVCKIIDGRGEKPAKIVITAPQREISAVVGNGRRNIEKLKEKYGVPVEVKAGSGGLTVETEE